MTVSNDGAVTACIIGSLILIIVVIILIVIMFKGRAYLGGSSSGSSYNTQGNSSVRSNQSVNSATGRSP